MGVKKILLAVCTLVLALGLAGCSFSLSDLKDIQNMMSQTEENTSDSAMREEPDDETLEEAAERLRNEPLLEEEESEGEAEEEEAEEEIIEEIPFSLADLLEEDEAILRTRVEERFLRYVEQNTASEYSSNWIPSSESQLTLAEDIAREMQDFGMSDVIVDDYGYVYGSIPATAEGAPVVGLIAHLDTMPELTNDSISPNRVRNYNGTVSLDEDDQFVLSVSEFPEMNSLIGDDLFTSDGSTLLGGDDKAGLAEIVTLCEYLLARPEIEHGLIRIAFIPDEEIGEGAEYFDFDGFATDFSYILDGGILSEGIQYETFNEAQVNITIQGTETYLGTGNPAKNAAMIASEFTSMLPSEETGRDAGSYSVLSLNGTAQKAELSILIRDYDTGKFDMKKNMLLTISDYFNERYGTGTVEITIDDQSYNMSETILANSQMVDRALQALQEIGCETVTSPNQWSTLVGDLTYRGVPCLNLPTGTANRHSVYECVSENQMTDVVKLLTHLVYAETVVTEE